MADLFHSLESYMQNLVQKLPISEGLSMMKFQGVIAQIRNQWKVFPFTPSEQA